MKVVKIKTHQDLRMCAEMYAAISDPTFLPFDVEKGIKKLAEMRRQGFVRMLVDDSGTPLAWIVAVKATPHHLHYPVMQQLYYCSDSHGALAYRCVRLLHESLVTEGIRVGAEYAMSTGSHMDEGNVFARILEKSGWQRKGHTAVLKL
ncbi:hypothetical protein N9112_00170 [bacterium]|nr:hypothetical protein [bacterium]